MSATIKNACMLYSSVVNRTSRIESVESSTSFKHVARNRREEANETPTRCFYPRLISGIVSSCIPVMFFFSRLFVIRAHLALTRSDCQSPPCSRERPFFETESNQGQIQGLCILLAVSLVSLNRSLWQAIVSSRHKASRQIY